MTYDRTNDISKGIPGTIDLDGALSVHVGSHVCAAKCLCMVWAPVTYPCFMVWVLSRDRNEGTNGFFDCGKNVVATTGSGHVSCSMWVPRVGDVLVNVPWQRRMARKNASLGVNEMWWMLLCRVIHPLGAQWLWVLSLVSGALLDYAWVIFGQQTLWCLIQGCYWNLHVRGTLWQQDPQAPKPCTKRSPYQVQKNLLSTDRTLRDMWCRADHKGVVRVWQRSIQSGSPGVGDLLLVVDSVAKVGFSSTLVQGVRLTMDMRPSLLQTVVAFASGLSRNRSDAEVLKGVMALFGEARSVDEEVLAEFTGLHLRRRDDQMVSKAATRVPGELTSKVRAVLAAAAAQSGVLSVSLAHLRLLPSLDRDTRVRCPALRW